MNNRVQLQLISSTKMGRNLEHETIRFPRKARENFGFSNSRVVIGKGELEVSLKVSQAYKEDVRKLAKMIQSSKITEKEALCVGFVSSQTRTAVTQRKGSQDVWVTEGIDSITVGADPEFGFISSEGTLVRGCNVIGHSGQFGSDGPGVELRPSPSSDHIQIVSNMRSILGKPPAGADSYRWMGGATYTDITRVYWFGGHIHLGRPAAIPADQAPPIYEKIATALDCLLAFPMVRFDTPNPHLRRNGCKYDYGKAGDIRSDYPERNRFEYRVLSGLWMVHPTLSAIAVGAAKCITETAYSRIAEQDYDLEWASNPISKKGMLKSFGIKGAQELRSVVNRGVAEGVTPDRLEIWEQGVKRLDKFERYKPEMKALIALSKENPDTVMKGTGLDVRENWLEGKTLIPRASKELRKTLDEVEEKCQ